jgi:hypothetical protein
LIVSQNTITGHIMYVFNSMFCLISILSIGLILLFDCSSLF